MASKKCKAPGSPSGTQKDRKQPRIKNYKLDADQKAWLDRYYGKYLQKKAVCGTKKKMNAKGWVSRTLLPKFIKKYYPNEGSDAGEEMAEELDQSLYSYYSNKFRDDLNRENYTEGDDGKINPENLWAEANKQLVDDAVAKRSDKSSNDPGRIGSWRSVVCDLFKALPAAEQSKWKKHASEECNLKAAESEAKLLQGAEKAKYIEEFFKRVNRLLKEGDRKAGVVSTIHMAAGKDEDGADTVFINSMTSPTASTYRNTKGHEDSAASYGEFLCEILGKVVDEAALLEAILPDHDGAPIIPDLPSNPTLKHLRKLVRIAFTEYAGGQGPIPWMLIKKDLDAGWYDWFEEARLPSELLPSGERVRFVDPGEMTFDECMIWLRHLKRCQMKEEDRATILQFQQVFASLEHEFPEYACISRKEKTCRGNNDVYLVKHDGYLDKPQTLEPIDYPVETWRYIYHLKAQPGLVHWAGLPLRPKHPYKPAIQEEEANKYLAWFKLLEEREPEIFRKVKQLIDQVNELERYTPVIGGLIRIL